MQNSFNRWLAIAIIAVSISGAVPAADHCESTAVGDVRTETFTSAIFGDPQTLRIWLPPGYNTSENATRSYPVLLMMDGQQLFDICTNAAGREWQIDETLTGLITSGKVQPLIVVGIDAPGQRRGDEYIPFPDSILGHGAETHGQRFPDFLASEVLQRVAHQFRIKTGPQNTAVGGSSYGAIAALYALLERPNAFGLGLIESPSLHIGNGELLRESEHLAVGPRRVYIGVGGRELTAYENAADALGLGRSAMNDGFGSMPEVLARNLKAAHWNHPEAVFAFDPEGQHNPQFWAARFPKAITFLFPPEESHARNDK